MADTYDMRIVERREHEGRWWGRRRDGAWLLWDMSSNGWEGPRPPPWPSESGDEADLPPPGRGMNPVDAWWNRRFPPFSRARLAFLIAATPVVGAVSGAIWAAMHGGGFSFPRYAFICVASAATVATGFLPGMRERAARLMRPDVDRVAVPLFRLDRTAAKDFVVALPFAYGVMLVVHLAVAGPTTVFSPPTLATQLIGALFTAAIVALRTSVWGLALLSIVAGLLGGFAVAILSLFTFSEPSRDEFLVGWLLGTITVFVFVWPMWQGMRQLEARGLRLPMWLVMGGSLLLVTGASLVFVVES